MCDPKNRILTDDARKSQNFYTSDLILNNYLRKHLKSDVFFFMNDRLEDLGDQAAMLMDEWSLEADKNPPELKKRTKYGNTVNEVYFHPSYKKLVEIAIQSDMFSVKYTPSSKNRFEGYRHKMGFAAGQLYAMGELGVYCPLCMTDGAAHLVSRYASDRDKQRLMSHFTTDDIDHFYSGAMFITEKSGGSDVGANLTEANHIEDSIYHLNGEKWFCSNVNADIIMTLARTGPLSEGTSGLSLFMIEKTLSNGQRNPMEIVRLKDKMGVKSMATGEVKFTDTVAKRLGEEGDGFKLMTEMINISRLYNSVAALAASRRALVEAYEYLNHRVTFGKRAIEHPMIREKFHELGSSYVGNFYLVWRTIQAMDKAENGNSDEAELMRFLIPLSKWWTGEQAVYTVRECMELLGGNGYIEDFVMPKLFRDVNVLPIWEGTGNIIALDLLRASEKSGGLDKFIEIIGNSLDTVDPYSGIIDRELSELLSSWQLLNKKNNKNGREILEVAAKPVFERFTRLFQMALMLETWDETSSQWISPSLAYMTSRFSKNKKFTKPISVDQVDRLMGWTY